MVGEIILVGFLIACVGYSFTQMVVEGELLAFYGRWANRVIHGQDYPPDPDQLNGLRWFIYKYTYCPYCLSGVLALLFSIAFFYVTTNPLYALTVPVSITTAKTLDNWNQH